MDEPAAPQDEQTPKARAWNPWPVGLIVAGGIGVTIVLTMVTIASRHPPIMAERGDYYEKSLAWDDYMKEVRASQALGYQARFEANRQTMRVRLTDAHKVPVTRREGTLRGQRADSERYDFEVPLKEVEPGLYEAQRPHQKSGLFLLYVRLDSKAGGHTWVDERREYLP